jgi:hypothetical protein
MLSINEGSALDVGHFKFFIWDIQRQGLTPLFNRKDYVISF